MVQLTEKQQQEIEATVLAGNKIEAIKLYREAVPAAGLAEGKEWVEKLEADLRAKHPEKSSSRPKKTGCLGLVAGLVALSVAVVVLVVVLSR